MTISQPLSKPEFECFTCRRKVDGVWQEANEFFKGRWLPGECLHCKEDSRKKRIEEEKRRVEEAFHAAGITKRFLDKTFENYEIDLLNQAQAKNVAVLKDFLERFDECSKKGMCLMLLGGVGSGKTHLASALVKSLIERKHTAMMTTVLRLLRSVKECYARDSKFKESSVIKQIETVDLLVIDEVGMQFNSEAENVIIFDIMNARYEAMKPTVLISNFNFMEIEKILGSRLIDRFYEGESKILIFDWESWRKQQRNTT